VARSCGGACAASLEDAGADPLGKADSFDDLAERRELTLDAASARSSLEVTRLVTSPDLETALSVLPSDSDRARAASSRNSMTAAYGSEHVRAWHRVDDSSARVHFVRRHDDARRVVNDHHARAGC
jgi:hypothetical protein